MSVGPASPADAAAVTALILSLPGGITEIFPTRTVAERVARAMFDSARTVLGWPHALVARVGGRVAGMVVRVPADAWRGLRLGSGPTMMRAAGLRAPAVLWRGSRQDRLMPPVPPGFLYVAALAVAPARRRHGIGTHLLRGVIAEADRERRRGVALDVAAGNDGAVALYRSLGFEIVGRRSIPPGRGLRHRSSVRMELSLGSGGSA